MYTYTSAFVTSLTLNNGVLRSLEQRASVLKVATLVEHLASCVGVGLDGVVQEERVEIGLKMADDQGNWGGHSWRLVRQN